MHFYDSWEDIFQGMCQDKGAAPAFWLLFSSFFFHFSKNKCCSHKISASIRGAALTCVALVYVDDGDLSTIALITSETAPQAALRHQHTVNYWSSATRTLGGALIPSKKNWLMPVLAMQSNVIHSKHSPESAN